METNIEVISTMGKFIVDASVKSEIVVLLHHQSGVMHLVVNVIAQIRLLKR